MAVKAAGSGQFVCPSYVRYDISKHGVTKKGRCLGRCRSTLARNPALMFEALRPHLELESARVGCRDNVTDPPQLKT
jgi:hypothetical protein